MYTHTIQWKGGDVAKGHLRNFRGLVFEDDTVTSTFESP